MKESLEQLLEANKNLIRSKAENYKMLGAEKDDLIQEGMIGLVKAYNSFDEKKGASFKTYADICITRQMLMAIRTAGRLKNSPLNMSLSLDKPMNDSDENAPTFGETLIARSESNPEYQVVYKELLEVLINPNNDYFSALEHQVLIYLLSGCDYQEIAKKMAKTPKQIDNTMQRIKKKLKVFLD